MTLRWSVLAIVFAACSSAPARVESEELASPTVALHEQCDDGDVCPFGAHCIGHPINGGYRSCEIPCEADPEICPDGMQCSQINDGPGTVCTDED